MGRKGPCDLAQVVRSFADACDEQFGRTAAQQRVCRAISLCRTAALGGQSYVCDSCGATHFVYHACRNRHCPKCQTRAKERWLSARQAELLPVPYYHLVFTLPHALNALVPGHARLVYDTLFQSAAQTLMTFARSPRWLGGTPGFTLVLHTWSQDLSRHVHVHGVVTGGALTPDGRWRNSRRGGFLFPVRALSKVFRGKYLEALDEARNAGVLRSSAWTMDDERWRELMREVRQHDWIVYAKRPFGGPQAVLDYLGRYTHRVAISDHRLLDASDTHVRFRARDRTVQGKARRTVLCLPGAEFLRRFLLHVLPQSFQRIRHYGLTASRCKAERLAACREQLHLPAAPEVSREPESLKAFWQRVAGLDIHRCPTCREGRLRWVATLAPTVHMPIRSAFPTGPPPCP